MRAKKPVISLILFLILLTSATGFAAKRTTYEDYQAQLYAFQSREKAAQQAIDAEKAMIADLQKQIDELNAQIAAVWDEIFALCNITREDYNAFLEEIAALEGRVKVLEQMAPQALLDHVDEISALEKRVAEMKKTKFVKISLVEKRLNDLAARIERLKNAIPKPKHDMYTVIRGDYLWRISGKKDIYSDPWKWMRIYSGNRDQIKNPDLIYPDQRLMIPRQIGRDEHLVAKGEYLSKIAGLSEVYGDPFKWTKIYQANKANGFISDPNRIFPEMILTIPRD